MEKSPYEQNYDRRDRTFDGRGVRLVVLFVLVAAVTFGCILLMMPPRRGGQDISDKAVRTVAESSLNSGSGGGDLSVQSAPAEQEPAVSNTEQQAEPPAEAEADSTEPLEAAAGSSGVTPLEQEPIKGRPHASDPADDEPEIAPDSVEPGGFTERMQRITGLLESGKYADVRGEAESLLATLAFNSRQWRDIMRVLGRANVRLYFQHDSPTHGEAVHTVKNGDTLFRIARQYGISVEALRRLNGMRSGESKLLVGKKLRVGENDWRIRIYKGARLLLLERGAKPFAVYDVGIGRLGRTPTGKFKIGEKIENPSYHSADGRTVAPGAPGNEFGTRWMRLVTVAGAKKLPQGYGIHGTADETSVTRTLSNGCIRMHNDEVEELFLIVPVNTPVSIEE